MTIMRKKNEMAVHRPSLWCGETYGCISGFVVGGGQCDQKKIRQMSIKVGQK